MNLEDWRSKWLLNDIGFNQKEPNILLQKFFTHLEIPKGGRIFVPLCGKSIDMHWLEQQGLEVVGVDISELACHSFFIKYNIPYQILTEADFFIYKSQKIILYCGDFYKLEGKEIREIDAIYDRAALIAIEPKSRTNYIKHMMKLISINTRILLITTSYDQSQMQGPPFSVSEQEVIECFSPYCHIEKLYQNTIKNIPEHLQEKGLKAAQEYAFLLIKR